MEGDDEDTLLWERWERRDREAVERWFVKVSQSF